MKASKPIYSAISNAILAEFDLRVFEGPKDTIRSVGCGANLDQQSPL